MQFIFKNDLSLCGWFQGQYLVLQQLIQ